ncbi:hypothetical protein K443DRAFT_316644 [Laccaria amethystina LaAM-08-1]|uniref:Uncharacterized protein n=1 Tax=Laccaria amethystina LaAM-08-1 TaxID=1095629 RepID=A0A0C9XDJ4_9AGAR|nr:hypothetical protein K443DRAFT_316644 [Laccaria amethystina LaAM-08-1]
MSSSPPVTFCGTSNIFCSVAPSNPLSVDKPAVTRPNRPKSAIPGQKIGQTVGPQIRYFWTRNGLSFPGPPNSYHPLNTQPRNNT